jgi:hypothetical protein
MANCTYVVRGDMTSKDSTERFPEKVLCAKCAARYEIILKAAGASEPCDDCGATDEEPQPA